MKILTNVKFAQTAGIAQVIFAFLDFIENSKKKNIKITAVNIIEKNEKTYRLNNGKKTNVMTFGVKIPNISNIIKEAKSLEDVKKEYEEIIQIYQKAIRKAKPDIILINGTYFMPWCLLMASKREKIPAVLHYHGVLSRETQNWKKPQRKIFLEMEKCFDRKDLFYIFPSKITKEVVEKEVFGHKIKKYSILPNPVPEHFYLQADNVNKKNIGIVSRWTGIKNISFCEELAEYNVKNGAKFVLNIITDLDSKNKKYKELSKIVKFHKPTSNKKLASFYKNMGVVISPSHFETYGNVAKEAIASGTPAIVNPNMGVAETFEKLGLEDWIVNFDSVKSIYKKIENTIGETITGDVRDKMKETYAPNKIFNEIVLILSNVLV
jgi:glycosyltransferase involved in cell wall biosynthesis